MESILKRQVDSKLTLAIKCLPKNKRPLEGTLHKLLWTLTSALFKNIYSMYPGMCFLDVHVLKAGIRHHEIVSSSGFNVVWKTKCKSVIRILHQLLLKFK